MARPTLEELREFTRDPEFVRQLRDLGFKHSAESIHAQAYADMLCFLHCDASAPLDRIADCINQRRYDGNAPGFLKTRVLKHKAGKKITAAGKSLYDAMSPEQIGERFEWLIGGT